MADLNTTYLGLNIKNPIVASSSEITNRISGIKEVTQAGAGAVVLKSLFEEQMNNELGGAHGDAGMVYQDEAQFYMQELGKTYAPQKYLEFVTEAKRTTDVPIIASVNCITTRWWMDYAKQIEDAGADALELNIALMPVRLDETADEVEDQLFEIVKDVRSRVSLPLVVKIGPYFTALPRVIQTLHSIGVQGVVLFNRFYQLDIDPETLTPVPGYQLSSSQELHLPLRWVAILSPKVFCEFSVSSGVHTAIDAAKSIVAGAQIVQIASVLFERKVSHITTMIDGLDEWLDSQGYASVNDARGQLAKAGKYQPEDLERVQYVAALAGAGW